MKIALLGDVALIGRYDRTQTNDVDERISAVKSILAECDFIICNLESPLTNNTKTKACKGVYIRSDIRNVETLIKLGVTHVTIANNHIFDYGKKGAEDTIRTLEHSGIKYVGLNNLPEKLVKGNCKILLDNTKTFKGEYNSGIAFNIRVINKTTGKAI